MKTEIEVKFLDVDFDNLREKLLALGAVCEQPMRLMRRVIIEPPHLAEKDAFVRIRDEGDKVTLTYKHVPEQSLTGAKEIEVTVSDFDATIALFEQAGLPYKSFQESRRETWRLGDVEVVLDEWPWLKPYIEIEGNDEQHVKDAAKTLGFNWQDAVFGKVTAAYKAEYPQFEPASLVTLPRATFGDPLPAIFSGQKEIYHENI